MQTDQLGNKSKTSILDKQIGKAKGEVNLSAFALLISEMVLYSHKRAVNSVDFQTKFASFIKYSKKAFILKSNTKRFSEFGKFIGVRILDLTYFREKKDKRETKFLEQLTFIKKNVWKSLYNKEADSVEKHATDPLLYYIVEKDPIINKFLPKDRMDYSCAYLNVGIIDGFLNESNFPCKVDLAHGENCIYYAITFDKSVIMREKPADLK